MEPVALQVSVVIAARNAAQTVGRTLAALAAQQLDGEYEVLVVDDGSTDETAAVVQRAPGPVTLIRLAPGGPGAARNAGVAQSSGAALAFCDADVYPTEGWLRAGLAALADADLVQGKVLPEPGVPLRPFDRTIWITGAVGLWECANLFVTRELFERVGGFEAWLQPRAGKALAEDVWLGYSAIRAGARTAYAPEALAYHAVFPRDWRGYVGERNRLRFFPAIARQAPELREVFLYRRLFLNRRTARFDLGVAGAALALGARSALPLALALPYARELRRHAGRARPIGPPPAAVAAADVAADVVGLVAMIRGSAEYRSLVL